MTGSDALHTHLETGITTVCRAWLLERRDGTQFGFTDHDLPLVFEETTFDANGGLTAGSLLQTSGLAIDNTEALGALSDERITEDDISAGLYDGAQVTAWLVNWADVTARKIMFRGTIGEIRRGDGRFEAELRGLTEVLNQPQGRSYLKSCSAVLGDGACGVDLTAPGVSVQLPLVEILNRQTLVFDDVGGHEDGWFARGFVTVVDGAGAGVSGVVKSDLREDGRRSLTLWEPCLLYTSPSPRDA